MDRFWSKVDKTDDCWLWTSACTPANYGVFTFNGRTVYAHRLAYELVVGPIPLGLELDHRRTCPKNCVRPDHLRPATRKQNEENRPGAQSNSKSGVRGVSWEKRRHHWRAVVMHNKKQVHVGGFKTIEEAEAAVIAKRLELFTHSDMDLVHG